MSAAAAQRRQRARLVYSALSYSGGVAGVGEVNFESI